MKDLLIIGTGNFSKVVKEYAARCEAFNKDWQIKGFLISDIDENRDIEGIVGDLSDYQPEENDIFICAYVTGTDRENAVRIIENQGGQFVNIIHPLSNICSSCVLGTGNVIGAFVSLSVNTKIGNHNIFQDHSNLGHDSIVGDYSHFYVGTIVCGKNRIEDRVSVFTGAIIYPGIKLESDAVVGAGSVVMRKVKGGTTVMGNPAKLLE